MIHIITMYMLSYRNPSFTECNKHNGTFHNKIISLNLELRYILEHTAIIHSLKQKLFTFSTKFLKVYSVKITK
jgi:hypothetical protein